ncbi:hypothetical protein GCM10011529_05650 [Polymorphobacter glacialis]|uniref:Uncharacterized protein n=1 Tax=Sandarakinorhabdus glacialis TaxID=1614636 RepID=A0A916ZLB0_9SPHN|nr:hypothetical protein [Polymorphobacter glacialis]GGE02109.1 hypothetical protein GCM10011529_05650 [Polymorphobacter glacialis]
MTDLIDGSVTTLRFGIANERLRSLSFNVTREAQEIYISSREFKENTLSLHSSQIHRLAENTAQPRKPIASTQLLKLIPGLFTATTRVLFTTRTGWDDTENAKNLKKIL